jgi:hypothetical protein
MKKVFLFSLIGLLMGCRSSQITSSWKDSTRQTKDYSKIMVLALIGDPDRTVREKMEEHLADDLRDLGYTAVTASEEYGPKAFEGLKEIDAVNLLAEKGIEAVITIVLLDKEKERYYVPGIIHNSPNGLSYQRFWNYYSTMVGRVYAPGYYTATDTRYFWESNFYDLFDSKLLYSVQSQSFTPESTGSLAHEYGQMIVQDMSKNSVLRKMNQQGSCPQHGMDLIPAKGFTGKENRNAETSRLILNLHYK